MRKLLTALSFLIFVSVAGCDRPNETASTEAVDNVVAELDEAYQTQDVDTIKARLAPDHVAVTPYYGAPYSAAEQIASLPDLKLKQTNLSEPKVVLLGPGIAMRTVTAKLEGTFKGTPIDFPKAFITTVVVKEQGKWLERLYQVTQLAP
jgi:ketosteroid isomerase-like protein